MKKLCILLLSVMVSGASFAQGGDSGSKVKFGIKAGVNFASMTFSSSGISVSPESVTSFHVGGLVDYSFSEKLSLQPGLMLSGKGFEIEGGGMDISTNLMYLEVPVNVVYKVGGLYFGAGPYAAFGLSGKIKAEGEDDEDVKFGNGDDELKGTDFGLNFLAGYQLTNGLNFGAGYGLGLSNLSNDGDAKTKNKVFSISVGFSF
ncbi:porin family protein [Pedobacter arcticus]|uniref:porin family protein n=1 Tax=Pedobacter arcticus TaxID=752140 RepID=UPI000379F277|nr:porin family protein [Pedobacter arcticus]